MGEGNIIASEMKLIGVNKESEKILSSVKVGLPDDDDVMQEFYIWPDKELMNWGVPVREVNGLKGKYNHSPFKVTIPKTEVYEKYAIEISWIHTINDKSISVQLYDEKSYWPLGTISPTDREGLQTTRFVFPNGFYEAWFKKQNTGPKVDHKYFDDNQILVDIIGRISGSKTFKDFAERWKDSEKLVPDEWKNKK